MPRRVEHLGGFLYVSDRLVGQILSGKAGNEYELDAVETKLGISRVEVNARLSRVPTGDSSAARARDATRVVRQQTGSIHEPHMPYLRVRLDAYIGTFHVVQGWDHHRSPLAHPPQRVLLTAATQVLWGKRIFVGLIGSEHNLRVDGVQRPVGYTQGRTPSDIHGLYDLFSKIREERDATPYESVISRDLRLSPLDIARETMSLAQGSPGDGPPRRVEVLLQRHGPTLANVILAENLWPYDLVVIGAPLWIREVLSTDGSLAPPMMDTLGDDAAHAFAHARLHSLGLAERAIQANQELKNIRKELESYDKIIREHESDGSLGASGDETRSTLGRLVSSWESKATYLDHTLRKLSEHEAAVEAAIQDRAKWPSFAKWFVTQSIYQGVPCVRLEVERKASIFNWSRRKSTGSSAEPTDIVGVILRLYEPRDQDPNHLDLGIWRDAMGRDLRFSGTKVGRPVMITTDGKIYPVSLGTHTRIDGRVRILYDQRRASGSSGGLGRLEVPQSQEQLIPLAARAILEETMRWRVTLTRNVPDSPILGLPFHRSRSTSPESRVLPEPVHIDELDAIAMEGSVEVDLDAD